MPLPPSNPASMVRQYSLRRRLRLLLPPAPIWHNPLETQVDAPLGRWNLYIGSAGSHAPGYVNLDLFALRGVDVAANAELLPFPDGLFTRVECDAVLEHAEFPERIVREIERVLAPGGHAHLVVPFCHPYHAYPADYRRYTPDGLRQLAGSLQVVAEGWRTGPTATLLVTLLEYAKLWMPSRLLRGAMHFTLGWLLFPFRYLDIWLLRSPRSQVLGNHCYVWLRKL
ncbi:MAG TPA: methyltransferase domain-containing protein [Bryobacteraceae bacterium]|nr:methyltransferase domain-containing protein [Bryobacteraceae bacterium]